MASTSPILFALEEKQDETKTKLLGEPIHLFVSSKNKRKPYFRFHYLPIYYPLLIFPTDCPHKEATILVLTGLLPTTLLAEQPVDAISFCSNIFSANPLQPLTSTHQGQFIKTTISSFLTV